MSSATNSNSEKRGSLENLVIELTKDARRASLEVAVLSTEKKNAILLSLAELLEKNRGALITENKKDIEDGKKSGLSKALLDRLKFTPERIDAMIDGVKNVAELPDPVGEEIESTVRPNGLDIRKIRVPIGVIGIIYESRPNVTIDCAILCLKSGNAAILRGGKEAYYSNIILSNIIQQSLVANDVSVAAVQLIPTTDRAALNILLKQNENVHCIIPRGGENLIRFVAEHARMPVIKHYKGICNLYIDKAADFDLAEKITINAKCQRPGVCNAIENLFVHRDVADDLLPQIANSLVDNDVEIRADQATAKILNENKISYKNASEEDYYEEYLDLILSIKIVDSLEKAIDAINNYGSAHSDAIITKDENAARKFMSGVDTSTVYWNASTRFTDGFEFGLGAEIGISTDRIHARGPMGLRELCTYKYFVFGNGQIK